VNRRQSRTVSNSPRLSATENRLLVESQSWLSAVQRITGIVNHWLNITANFIIFHDIYMSFNNVCLRTPDSRMLLTTLESRNDSSWKCVRIPKVRAGVRGRPMGFKVVGPNSWRRVSYSCSTVNKASEAAPMYRFATIHERDQPTNQHRHDTVYRNARLSL